MWQQIRDFFAGDPRSSSAQLRAELDELRADHDKLVARHQHTWDRLLQMSYQVRTRQLVIVDENGREGIIADAETNLASILLSGVGPIGIASGDTIQIELLATEEASFLNLTSFHDGSQAGIRVYNYDEPARFTHRGADRVSLSFPLEGPQVGADLVSVLATKDPGLDRPDSVAAETLDIPPPIGSTSDAPGSGSSNLQPDVRSNRQRTEEMLLLAGRSGLQAETIAEQLGVTERQVRRYLESIDAVRRGTSGCTLTSSVASCTKQASRLEDSRELVHDGAELTRRLAESLERGDDPVAFSEQLVVGVERPDDLQVREGRHRRRAT